LAAQRDLETGFMAPTMTRTIRYAPERAALYHPELDPSLLKEGVRAPSPDALCAELARLVYRRFEATLTERDYVASVAAVAGFSETHYFNAGGSEAFAAFDPATRTVVASFRGTQSDDIRDFITDIRIRLLAWPSGGSAHSGFARAAQALMEAGLGAWLAEHRDCARTYTGHSLGAALATLVATLERPARLVTFGSPRVGDSTFTQALDRIDIHRYVDCCDVVTRLPPSIGGYRHVGAVHYIDRFGMASTMSDLKEAADDQEQGRRAYLREHALKPGTVALRDLADHAPANYVYPLFGIAA
jgi:hypothetical protein